MYPLRQLSTTLSAAFYLVGMMIVGAAGAPRDHWAYIPPERPDLPAIDAASWVRNPIDYFILDRLEQEGLTPSNAADRATLIRRLSLDLIGLPPTLDEVKAFEGDTSPDAYEKVVDRLLASPHYGERWARPWLDMARYADTQGYEKDAGRTIWPYRDWVIRAFNDNLPFDRFTVEQLAGDMLSEATVQQKVATGFHRNTMTNTEGGTDDEEFRHAAVVDRVNTTMTVWMGSTFGCAQCHDHKYDPFSMEEYYRMYAFFNNTADADRANEHPIIEVPTQEQKSRRLDLEERIAALEEQYGRRTPELQAAQREWEQKTLRTRQSWRVLQPDHLTSAGGARLIPTPDGGVLAGGTNPDHDVYMLTANTELKRITGVRLEVLPHESLPKKSLGRHPNGSFVLSEVETTVAPRDRPESARPLNFNEAEADHVQKGHSVSDLIDEQDGPGWAVDAANPDYARVHTAYFEAASPVTFESGTELHVTLRHASKWAKANLGHFRLAVTDQPDPVSGPVVSRELMAILAKETDHRSEEERAKLREYYHSIAPALKPVREELASLRREKKELDSAIPTTPVMKELEEGRETHVLVRGNFLNEGKKVSPGVPEILHELPENQPANRLTLARWLVDEANPLTARVIMNRIWEQYFGKGIVLTSEDFGTQCEPPTHPDLLDWLATEFMDRDWDLKAMHKLIVMSATYRQSSHTTPNLVERDPFNRLYARGPRFRLPAEQIRDQALAISGLLCHEMGGPSVMPPQPDGLWQVVYNGSNWETSQGGNKYRRGLYTFWRRTMPHPGMTTFDAPSREFCVVQRSRSNTPLQALNLMNDPVYIEAAQALARRIMTEADPGIEERAHYGFRLCLARSPKAEETRQLIELYHDQLNDFQQHPKAAREMATSQLGPVRDEQEPDMAELAAWTVVGNVLLNLDETVTKS